MLLIGAHMKKIIILITLTSLNLFAEDTSQWLQDTKKVIDIKSQKAKDEEFKIEMTKGAFGEEMKLISDSRVIKNCFGDANCFKEIAGGLKSKDSKSAMQTLEKLESKLTQFIQKAKTIRDAKIVFVREYLKNITDVLKVRKFNSNFDNSQSFASEDEFFSAAASSNLGTYVLETSTWYEKGKKILSGSKKDFPYEDNSTHKELCDISKQYELASLATNVKNPKVEQLSKKVCETTTKEFQEFQKTVESSIAQIEQEYPQTTEQESINKTMKELYPVKIQAASPTVETSAESTESVSEVK